MSTTAQMVRAALCAVALGSLLGCSDGGDGATPSTTTAGTTTSTPSSVPAVDDVLLQTSGDRRDQALLLEAEHDLVEACMAEAGFDITYSPSEPRLIVGLAEPDMEYRRAQGYGGATPPPSIDGEPPVGTPELEEYGLVRDGPPDDPGVSVTGPDGQPIQFGSGGCTGEARTELYGSVEDFIEAVVVPEDQRALIDQVAFEGDDLLAVQDEWVACMEARGYSYDSPFRAYQAFTQSDLPLTEADQEGTEPAQEPAGDHGLEVATAVADGECQIEVGMPEVIDRLRQEQIDQLPDAVVERLEEAMEIRGRALAEARRITGG